MPIETHKISFVIIQNTLQYGAKIICTGVRGKVMASLTSIFFLYVLGGLIYSNPLIIWNENIVYLQNEHPGFEPARLYLYLSPLWSMREKDEMRNAT